MKRRRLFISFQHGDRMKGKGFDLLQYNKNVDLEFTSRHFLDPVDSKNEDYIKAKVKEQLKGTSVTVVLIGKETHESDWVKWEIEQSQKKDNPNGILGIRLKGISPLPPDSPVSKALHDAGAEIIPWEPDNFANAIDRAARQTAKAQAIKRAPVGGSTCRRK